MTTSTAEGDQHHPRFVGLHDGTGDGVGLINPGGPADPQIGAFEPVAHMAVVTHTAADATPPTPGNAVANDHLLGAGGIVVVDNAFDAAIDGITNLRQAIAELDANGGGTIEFANPNMNNVLLSALDITGDITIIGNYANGTPNVTITGSGSDRVLDIEAGATVKIEAVELTGGYATVAVGTPGTSGVNGAAGDDSSDTGGHGDGYDGGTGGTGGVGEAGQGGAILNHGTLTLIDSLVTGNTAIGGAGGAGGIGGGGGLGVTGEKGVYFLDGFNGGNGGDGGTGGVGGAGEGGGIYSDGDLVLDNTDVTGNITQGGRGGWGGIGGTSGLGGNGLDGQEQYVGSGVGATVINGPGGNGGASGNGGAGGTGGAGGDALGSGVYSGGGMVLVGDAAIAGNAAVEGLGGAGGFGGDAAFYVTYVAGDTPGSVVAIDIGSYGGTGGDLPGASAGADGNNGAVGSNGAEGGTGGLGSAGGQFDSAGLTLLVAKDTETGVTGRENAIGNLFQIIDGEAGQATVQLSVTIGTLTLTGAGHATETGQSLDLSGTVQNVDQYLSTLKYAGPATGDGVISISVADAFRSVAYTVDLVVTCFAEGTCIATEAGEVPVEQLQPGQHVRLADGSLAPLRWLGHSRIAWRGADPLHVLPIRIRAGALGGGLPRRDLLVSPGHALFLDGLLVQAGALVNGAGIVRETRMPEQFSYWHVELDTHALLIAEGVATESFLEGAEPVAFDNAAARIAPLDARQLPYPRCKSARQVPRALASRLMAVAPAGVAGPARPRRPTMVFRRAAVAAAQAWPSARKPATASPPA